MTFLFCRFLYRELHRYKSGDQQTIFRRSLQKGNDRLQVQKNITFHLYTSACPCGDASLFSR